MLKVDLLPEDIEQKRRVRLRNISIIILVLIIILGGGVYFGLDFYKGKVEGELERVRDEVIPVQEETTKVTAELEEALLAQKQLDNLERLLNERMYWTLFFQELGRITIPDVFYTNFSGDIDSRTVSLPARTRNYQALARQLKAWENEEVLESVEVTSASLESTEDNSYVSFDVNLTFKEEAWQEK